MLKVQFALPPRPNQGLNILAEATSRFATEFKENEKQHRSWSPALWSSLRKSPSLSLWLSFVSGVLQQRPDTMASVSVSVSFDHQFLMHTILQTSVILVNTILNLLEISIIRECCDLGLLGTIFILTISINSSCVGKP